MKWCWEVQGVAVDLMGWGAAEASLLEIGEEGSLELEGGEATGASVVKSQDRVRVATGYVGWCAKRQHPWRFAPLGGGDVISWEWDERSW